MRALSASSNVSGCSETGLALGIRPRKMATQFGRSYRHVNYWTAGHAENASSEAFSASCYDFREDVRILPVVMTERKFREIEQQILLADIVKCADDPAFQQALSEMVSRTNRFNVGASAFSMSLQTTFPLRAMAPMTGIFPAVPVTWRFLFQWRFLSFLPI